MVAFTGGQKLRASSFNAVLPIFGRVTSDVTKNANTTLGDVTGLSVTVEASSTYILDGYIAYDSGATPDLKMAITVPTGTTGHWTLYGLATTTTGSIGVVDGHRITAFGDANTMTAGGSDSFSSAMTCLPRAYIVVSTTAGTVQFRFAQNTSNASNTVIKTGSWIRAVKIA